MKQKRVVLIVLAALVIAGGLIAWNFCKELGLCKPTGEPPLDEAKAAGRGPETLPGADEDYFADMDYGITRDPEAVRAALDPWVPGISAADAVKAAARGRNNWIVWTAGNDRLWDELSRRTFGSLDLLKTVSNHPSLEYGRHNRWYYLGLVNEPCFEKGTGPREDRFGLWLDVRVPESTECPQDPFENERKYPGVKLGARGRSAEFPVGSYYGYATGVVGLRLFPNPDFDAQAQAGWDPVKYYTDESYYNRKDLVKPYRVGMSCGFCHVGPNPTRPPADPENPAWADLNSNPGAQYFWIDRILVWKRDPASFIYQLIHTSRPGALDTSLVSSDQINNPRTMNAVYNLAARLELAKKWGHEKLAGGELNNAQLNNYVPAESPLAAFYKAPDDVWTTRVLKDGADSVGALGALNRVYVNIGLYSEEWLRNFIPLVGGPSVTPFRIAVAREKSSYWLANEQQTPDLALFFLATARPDDLKSAPGGGAYLAADAATLKQGKLVFAERCARCHSSKLPDKAFSDFFPGGCVGPNYLTCWDDYWKWTKTDEFKSAMRDIVLKDDFTENNFLSTELRVPVTLLETNACSPLATNALAGDIWNDFSSSSYKSLPAVGKLLVHHPIDGTPWEFDAPGGGRGYTRPASLVSLWSTAPFLLSNALGDFYWTGTVEDRMQSFDDAVEQLLWPEKRKGERRFVTRSGKSHPGVIDLTTERSYLRLAPGYLPDVVEKKFPDGIRLGPIPAGVPVNLLSNIDVSSKGKVLEVGVKLLPKVIDDLKKLPEGASDEEARAVFRNLVKPLLDANKCPDFVVNRGHYFGTDYLPASEGEPGLSDADKRALIEFLKTL